METRRNLAVLLERLSRVLQNEAHADGLKPTQWEALRYLDRANRFSRTPSALTAYLGMTKGTVSQTINALERKGLVRKQTGRSDRRKVQIVLTEQGARLLTQDPVDAIMQSVPPNADGEWDKLHAGLEGLLSQALKRRGGRPFGVCATCRYFMRDVPGGDPHRCALLDVALSRDDSARICVEQEPAE